MIEHAEARMLASARADGEAPADRLGELDQHLGGCAPCASFAAALPTLSAMAALLPREHAPEELAVDLRRRLKQRPSRRRLIFRLAPSLAAALTVALTAVLVGPSPLIRIPRAEAAEALGRVGSLFVEREIDSTLDPETGARDPSGGRFRTQERIWFQAPAFVRVERSITSSRGTRESLEITRPGERYVRGETTTFHDVGLLPDARLPEPLSPTLALLGHDTGPGPVVSGRPTRRIEVNFDEERRVAFVDAERFSVLGVEESVVLQKERFAGDAAVKRTVRIEYNPSLPDSLFEIPEGRSTDHGFRPGTLAALTAPPIASFEDLRLVISGSGPDGQAALFARGALRLLVTIDAATAPREPFRTMRTTFGSRAAEVILSLYDLPRLDFRVGEHTVSISAPLEPDQLVHLASQMYPE